jgi:type I restriction enzyme S subunit
MNTGITQKIADIAEVNPSVDLRGLRDDTLVSFIPMSDITDTGRWVGMQERRLDAVRVGYTPFAEGDILFAKITPCMENGKGVHARGLRNGVGFGSTEFHVLRAKGQSNPRFLFHWLQAHPLRLRAIAYMGGSAGQQRVQSDFFTNFRIPHINPAEQSRIASVLDTVDEAIARTEAVIAKLRKVCAGLLHDLLTRGLNENGELRDHEHHPDQFIESSLGTIPKAWRVGSFRDFGSPDRPYLKTGPFGSSLKQEHWVPEGVPVVTIGSLGEGQFIRSELLYVSVETARLLSAYSLLPGDIVFSRVADVGRSVVVTDAESGWIMSSNMMWISLDRRIADPDYVQANIAANPVVRAQIRRHVNAAGRDVANAVVMNALLLPWAPFDEQRRIVSALRSLNSRLQSEEIELQKLRLLRQGLMTDLLTGRVRVRESVSAVENQP